MSPSEPIFSIRGLTKQRIGAGATFELYVPELTVYPGQVVVLKGVSGSGKSTLLDILAMVLRPDKAEHFTFTSGTGLTADVIEAWRQQKLSCLARLRGEHIGYVLQMGGLLSFLTARENIGLSCRLLGRPSRDAVDVLASRLDIAGQLDKLPGQLSVGERQRVAIARALVHRPRVLLADEPTASVDPFNAHLILDLLLEVVKQLGVTAVIATHDWQQREGFGILKHNIEREGQITRSSFWN